MTVFWEYRAHGREKKVYLGAVRDHRSGYVADSEGGIKILQVEIDFSIENP